MHCEHLPSDDEWEVHHLSQPEQLVMPLTFSDEVRKNDLGENSDIKTVRIGEDQTCIC